MLRPIEGPADHLLEVIESRWDSIFAFTRGFSPSESLWISVSSLKGVELEGGC